ncbi:PepSY-associated TM helix domain-containing protein [Aquimarina sp. W85]|uniref:PepSY-associated TM helix domain-containing protein n=1 Tax=Aquimarina rhodophyticola TaxID=3342246 RepID=UPI00367011FE
MSKRTYNVFFHTHTVSGIVISVALYIMFFAGAFALVKDEITAWEKGTTTTTLTADAIDYEKLVKTISDDGYELYGRDIRIIPPDAKKETYVILSASQDSAITTPTDKPTYFFVNQDSYAITPYYGFYSLGELLYRLHFFHQIPTVGIYIAGFVAFFFLFAIITGIVIHWKKIISNFNLFRPTSKLKTIWTDAHTALGVLGIPFQLVFAVTSCFLCLSTLVLLPANFIYDNDQKQLLEDLRPMSKTYPIETKADTVLNINDFMKKATTLWDNFEVNQIYIRNYGDVSMKLQVDGLLGVDEKFVGYGRVVYDLASNSIESIKNPYDNDYVEAVEIAIKRLHFGDYGGIWLKALYFLMALITCFVIITGVLIWLEARNKKKIPIAQKLYNRKVGHIYMAICLSMFPITALTFIVSKLIPSSLVASRMTLLYIVFFVGWLLLTLFFRFKRDNYYTNRYSLLSGGLMGLIIPIVNGMVSGNWLWRTILEKNYDVLIIDVLWIILSLIALFIYSKLKRPVPKVDHNNLKTIYYQELKAKNSSTQINNYTKRIKFMRTKISIYWLIISVGFILHHIYGLFGVYYNESLMIEGATGDVPLEHHLYRILFEGIAMVFCLTTLEISKNWFKQTSLIWAILLGVFNIYHFITAIIYETSNVSEILILALMATTSGLLVRSIQQWTKEFE